MVVYRLDENRIIEQEITVKIGRQKPDSGLKWTILKDNCWPSLKWTVGRKWTVSSQIELLFEPEWTILVEVNDPSD